MSQKLYFIVSGFIFLLVGIFHVFRLVYQWPIIVGPRVVPYALSFVGGPVSLGYSIWAGCLLFSKRGARQRHPNAPTPTAKP